MFSILLSIHNARIRNRIPISDLYPISSNLDTNNFFLPMELPCSTVNGYALERKIEIFVHLIT